MTCVLAVDSSTEALAVALVRPDGGVLAVDGAGGAQASARLVPEALRLLADAGLTLAALDAVAFGRGPGAFTGLRVAASVAQGFALGAGKPVLPIDSLLIVAEDARAQGAGDDLTVVMDARMDEVYAARYRHRDGRWETLQPPTLWSSAALASQWATEPPAGVAGTALAVFGERLGLPEAVPRWPASHARAAALGRLAAQALARGEAVDAALALPVYVRDKVAQTTAEREAARAAKADA